MALWLFLTGVQVALEGGRFADQLLSPSPVVALTRAATIVSVWGMMYAAHKLACHRVRAERVLRIEQERVRQVYETCCDSIIEVDCDYRILHANPSALKDAQVNTGDSNAPVCYQALHGRSGPCEHCMVEQVVAQKRPLDSAHVEFGREENHWIERVFSPLLGADGEVLSVVESVRDATSLRAAREALSRSNADLERSVSALIATNDALFEEVSRHEQTASALRESEGRYRHLVESLPLGVFVHHEGRILFANSVGKQMLGFSPDESAVGLLLDEYLLLSEDDPSQGSPSGFEDDQERCTARLACHDGRLLDVEISRTQLHFEGAEAVQYVVWDVSDREKEHREMRRIAYRDVLTGLPNRALFEDRLAVALAQADRRGETLALVFADLDGFKAVNDMHGHEAGDDVLRTVSARFGGLVRGEDTLARLGGDEFVLLARVTNESSASALAERMLQAARDGVALGHTELRVGASLGIAIYPRDADSASQLIRRADAAMYQAKSEGGNRFAFFGPQMERALEERAVFDQELGKAVERGQLELIYQPQVDARDGSIKALEALLRWNHPERGPISPMLFLDRAEELGHLDEIERWVVSTACRDAAGWLRDGLAFDCVSVNVSAGSIADDSLVETVAAALAESGLEPERLELELAGFTAADHTPSTHRSFLRLSRLGVRLAIDDLGIGRSLVNFVRRYDVDTVKIARDLVKGLSVSPEFAVVTSALINLCSSLGLRVVAEGVERVDQLDALLQEGCQFVQGYLARGPVSASEVPTLLADGLPDFALVGSGLVA